MLWIDNVSISSQSVFERCLGEWSYVSRVKKYPWFTCRVGPAKEDAGTEAGAVCQVNVMINIKIKITLKLNINVQEGHTKNT